MASSPTASTLIRSSARAASRNGIPRTVPRASRKYATDGGPDPLPPSGNNNSRPLMIAGLVGVPTMAYFLLMPRESGNKNMAPANEVHTSAVNLDPAARKRAMKDGTVYAHPEMQYPDDFKPAFGQLHQRKRVDGPPDGRHHQAMQDRLRQN